MRRTHRPRLLSPLFLTLSLGLAGEVGAGPLINGEIANFAIWPEHVSKTFFDGPIPIDSTSGSRCEHRDGGFVDAGIEEGVDL